MSGYDEKTRQLYVCAYKMNIYKMKLNETVELEAMQTKALADQCSEEMV